MEGSIRVDVHVADSHIEVRRLDSRAVFTFYASNGSYTSLYVPSGRLRELSDVFKETADAICGKAVPNE